MRYALLVSALLVAVAAGAPIPPPTAREATQLIEKLGSEDYTEREAATKRLDELGLLALAELRAATKSENAEIADRAKDLVRKIERRASNDRALAPTLVELDLKEAPLDTVLAELSKQAKCEVVLGGLKPEELAGKKITVATTGKVPFWNAVLKVCDAAGLQIAGASGFYAPGAIPYAPKRAPNVAGPRVASNANNAVILEAREGKKRPASVHGAVVIEAFELPKIASSRRVAASVLQLWPEPRLGWQSTADVKVTSAVDAKGDKLLPDFTHAVVPHVERIKGGNVVVVKNADGTVTIVNPDAEKPLPTGPDFAPNSRQGLLRLKTDASLAAEITGAVYGIVRSPAEPLVVINLVDKEEVTATGPAGTEAMGWLHTDTTSGKQVVNVKLIYEPLKVNPVRTGEELPEIKLAAGGNQTIHGLRITDADGKAFEPALVKADNGFDTTGQRRIILNLKLELPIVKDGPTVPKKLVFWGTYAKSVGVPFTLKDVSLVGGSK